MADIHIEDFYKDVALIFLRLYSTFPKKGILYVDDICGPDDPDEFGLHSDRFVSAFSAMVQSFFTNCFGELNITLIS